MAGNSAADGCKLLVSLDVGTRTLTTAARVVSPPSPPAAHNNIFEPMFANGKKFAPQIIGFVMDDEDKLDRIISGTEAEKAIDSGMSTPSHHKFS